MCAHRILFAALLAVAYPVLAQEAAYVIDKLLVGVHENQDLDSPIVKVLPTGTKLEVLQRDGELAHIKDPDGATGWVDSAYLMAEPPAALQMQSLNTEITALRLDLEKARSANPGTADSAERDTLTKENTDLKRKLAAEKLTVESLQKKLGELETAVSKLGENPTAQRVAELESTNLQLSKDLEAATQNYTKLESQLEKAARASSPSVKSGLSTISYAGIGLAMLLAFGGGVYYMDYRNRQRHGGFRV